MLARSTAVQATTNELPVLVAVGVAAVQTKPLRELQLQPTPPVPPLEVLIKQPFGLVGL